MIRKLLKVCWISLSLGCSATIVAHELDSDGLPKEWAVPSAERIANTECPNIQGFYNSEGQIISWTDNSPTRDKDVVSDYISVWHPRGADVSIHYFLDGNLFRGDLKNVFQLKESERGYQVLRRSENDKIEVTEFDKTRGDYYCSNGWMLFDKSHHAGSSEGGFYIVETELKATKLADGGMLYRQVIRSSRRDFLFFSRAAQYNALIYFAPIKINGVRLD